MRIEVSIAKTTALPNGALEALNNELSRRIAEQFPAIDSQVKRQKKKIMLPFI